METLWSTKLATWSTSTSDLSSTGHQDMICDSSRPISNWLRNSLISWVVTLKLKPTSYLPRRSFKDSWPWESMQMRFRTWSNSCGTLDSHASNPSASTTWSSASGRTSTISKQQSLCTYASRMLMISGPLVSMISSSTSRTKSSSDGVQIGRKRTKIKGN